MIRTSVPRSMPVVVYLPKYDEKVREEFQVEFKAGVWIVIATRIGKRPVSIPIGKFSSYKAARDAMFGDFYNKFNRSRWTGQPGIWDATAGGRWAIRNTSILEGAELVSATATVVTERMPTGGIAITKVPIAPTFYTKFIQKRRRVFDRFKAKRAQRFAKFKLGRRRF